MKYFVVAYSDPLPEDTDRIAKKLERMHCAWWSWIPGVWLVAAKPDLDVVLTSSALRDIVWREIDRGVSILVSEVEPARKAAGTSGFARSSEERDHQLDWIRSWWPAPESEQAPTRISPAS